MRIRAFAPVLMLPLVAWVVPACTTLPPQDEGQQGLLELHELRSDRLRSQETWGLSGKLGISDGKDGGSGTLNWQNSPGSIRMDFHGALGRGAWRLQSGADGAVLELADGESYQAGSVDELARAQLGWEIPVGSLSWWVRGMAAPGEPDEQSFDQRGNLVRLEQDGWSIEFDRYRAQGDLDMPVSLTARRADWKVRLAVRNWKLPPAATSDG